MLRFIEFITKLFITIAIAMLFTSCVFDMGITGNGKVTTETRNIDADFTSVEVNRGIEVEIQQSDKKSIVVTADSNLQKHILTDITNGVLTITSDENIKNSQMLKVIVTMPIIDALQSSSAAEIKSKSTIKSDDLKLNSSSGSEMNIAVEGENLAIQTSSGSSITVAGKVLELNAQAASGSEIDAEKALSNKVTAEASSGAVVNVYPLVTLNAKASSGGSITYHNNPKEGVTKKASSGGTISN